MLLLKAVAEPSTLLSPPIHTGCYSGSAQEQAEFTEGYLKKKRISDITLLVEAACTYDWSHMAAACKGK